MYLRIQNNCIRYRLSKVEAGQVLDGESLSDSLKLTPHLSLAYQVLPTEQMSQFDYNEKENCLCLFINQSQLRAELEGRPSKQGISVENKPIGNKPTTLIDGVFLEVDLKNKKPEIEQK